MTAPSQSPFRTAVEEKLQALDGFATKDAIREALNGLDRIQAHCPEEGPAIDEIRLTRKKIWRALGGQ